jgi:hypothetical protein
MPLLPRDVAAGKDTPTGRAREGSACMRDTPVVKDEDGAGLEREPDLGVRAAQHREQHAEVAVELGDSGGA